MVENSRMVFRRYGRSLHLKIESAEDLENILELDEAHWVATSAPAGMFNCDRLFLDFLDRDNTGRIRSCHVKQVISFALDGLRDRRGITDRSDRILLDAIAVDTQTGRQLKEATEQILKKLNKDKTEALTLEQLRELKAQIESTAVSEAGVALPEAVSDETLGQFIRDVISAVGGAEHPSGQVGIDLPGLERFIEQARSYLDWYEKGLVTAGKRETAIMPLGSETPRIYGIFASIQPKVEQYFAQCRALALDERFADRIGLSDKEVSGEKINFDDPAEIDQLLKKAPLAKPRADGVLDFKEKINPYYAECLERFRREVLKPILGGEPSSLSAEQWQQVKSFFEAHRRWLQEKPGEEVASLGPEKLKRYLDSPFAEQVRSLIAESRQTAALLEKVRLLEKLALCQLNLLDFVNNFVSFPYLYDPNRRAMFEMGTLIMDGRRFNLAVVVPNPAEHKSVAANSNMYVLYVQATSKAGDAKLDLAVPVTSGGKGNLCVGKRGIFHDVFGRTYDAQVTDIIENPISFSEALLSPFRRLGRVLVGKIESITTSAEQKLQSRVSSVVEKVAEPQQLAQPAPAQPAGGGAWRAGLLMGAGVSIAAIGSAAAYITKTLATIQPSRVLVAIAMAAVAVMLPVSLVAMFKLRRRDLSAILEGSGWAINAKMRLSRKQSLYFTQRPAYPKGAGLL